MTDVADRLEFIEYDDRVIQPSEIRAGDVIEIHEPSEFGPVLLGSFFAYLTPDNEVHIPGLIREVVTEVLEVPGHPNLICFGKYMMCSAEPLYGEETRVFRLLGRVSLDDTR